MLFVIFKGNHPELAYRGGQPPVIHLEFDMYAVVRWAEQEGVRWAFSLSSAAAFYTEFRNTRDAFAELDWEAIQNTNFAERSVREAKQAEFLVNRHVPWSLVERIGTQNTVVHQQVTVALQGAGHRPPVEIRPGWYY